METKLSLKVLQENDDVIGAFVADGKQVLCSCMPSDFTESQINIAIDVCNKSIIGTRIGSFATDQIVYYMQDCILLVRHVVEHVFLFVVCKPVKDLPLLDIYINIMIDEIETYLEKKEEVAKLPTVQELKDGHLGSFSSKLQEWLANYLGPVAFMVMDEALEAWIEQGNPTEDHFEDLFKILDSDLPLDAQKQMRIKFGDLI